MVAFENDGSDGMAQDSYVHLIEDDNNHEGTLIVDGEEETEDVSLNASGIDISQVDFEAIASKIVVPDDYMEEEANHEDVVEEGASTHALRLNKKDLIVALVVAVLCVLVCLDRVALKRSHERNAQMERELREAQRKMEEDNKLKKSCDDWQEGDEDWELAHNCYVEVKLGDCTKKKMEEWNDVAKSVWDSFENFGKTAWDTATKWGEEEEDGENEGPTMASVSVEAFSQVSHAVADFMGFVKDTASQTTHEIARGILTAVDDITELTRDAVEDGTAFSRPKSNSA